MILSLILLFVVILSFMTKVHGARRYLFGTSIQPSELAKLADGRLDSDAHREEGRRFTPTQ